jgi:SNF2 family DNA or RNA helicase
MNRLQRADAVRAFSDPRGETSILLISLRAGGVGLNLTVASAVILVDPWWNPAIEDQAIDRVHRLGQNNPVHVYRMICEDSVEEKLLDLQERKRAMSNKAIGRSSQTMPNIKLSLEDLKGFFV